MYEVYFYFNDLIIQGLQKLCKLNLIEVFGESTTVLQHSIVARGVYI